MSLIQVPHPLRGIDVAFKKHKVVTTADDNRSVTVRIGDRQCVRYHVDEGSIVHSWFAPSHLKITSAVVKVSDGQFAVIVNGTQLLLWDGKESKLDKVDGGLELGEKAASLLKSSEDTYVVFESGAIQTVDYIRRENRDGESGVTPIVPEGFEIYKTWVRNVGGRGLVTHHCKAKNPQEGGALVTGRLALDSETGETKVGGVNQMPLDKGVVVVEASTTEDHVFTADKSGAVKRHAVYDKESVHRVAEIPDLSHMCAFDGDYICVAAGPKVFLINSKYGSVVADRDAEFDCSGFLSACGSRIFFRQLGGPLASATVSMAELPRTLASMIGDSDAGGTKSARARRHSSGGGAGGAKTSDAVDLYRTLPSMFERRDVTGVKRVLERGGGTSDIPELLVISIIEFLFLLVDEDFAEDATAAQVAREKLLSKAFDVPVTESMMLSYLCQIDFEIATKMVEFVNISLKLQMGTMEVQGGNYFTRLVEWMGLLLNAHYTNILLLSRDDDKVAELVEDVSKTVGELESSASLCSSVLPLANLVRDKKCIEPSYANKTYCIEIVEL